MVLPEVEREVPELKAEEEKTNAEESNEPVAEVDVTRGAPSFLAHIIVHDAWSLSYEYDFSFQSDGNSAIEPSICLDNMES